MAPFDGYRLERLEAGCAEEGVSLSAEAGWNQTAEDWRLMLTLGECTGLRDTAGRLVASALVLPHGEDLAWISMVLVAAGHRRRGLASELLRRAVARIRASGRAAVLDATPAGERVYRPLGFAEVYRLQRLEARLEVPPPAAGDAAIRKMEETDLAGAVAYDRPIFGADRSPVLAHLRGRCPEQALIAERDGRVVGFALVRDGREALQLGPLVADDAEIARALAAAVLRDLRGRIFLDVAERQVELAAWLARLGFAVQRPFTRMVLGRQGLPDDPARIFASAGPELG